MGGQKRACLGRGCKAICVFRNIFRAIYVFEIVEAALSSDIVVNEEKGLPCQRTLTQLSERVKKWSYHLDRFNYVSGSRKYSLARSITETRCSIKMRHYFPRVWLCLDVLEKPAKITVAVDVSTYIFLETWITFSDTHVSTRKQKGSHTVKFMSRLLVQAEVVKTILSNGSQNSN